MRETSGCHSPSPSIVFLFFFFGEIDNYLVHLVSSRSEEGFGEINHRVRLWRRESDNDERLSAARQDASQRVANCSARKKRYRAYQTVISRDRRYEARQPSFLLPCWAGIAPFHHRYLLHVSTYREYFSPRHSLSLDIFFEIPCNFENNFLGNRFRF